MYAGCKASTAIIVRVGYPIYAIYGGLILVIRRGSRRGY